MENKRIKDEIPIIAYYRVLLSKKEARCIDEDEAVISFISQGYASKYNEVWYDGIAYEELKYKMFGDGCEDKHNSTVSKLEKEVNEDE